MKYIYTYRDLFAVLIFYRIKETFFPRILSQTSGDRRIEWLRLWRQKDLD